jgi:hypothetical protein
MDKALVMDITLLKQFLIILFLLFNTLSVWGQTIFRASDYGVKSNSFENASIALQKIIDACKTKNDAILLLPGGRIDIWPEGAPKRELYISNCTENDTLSKRKNIAFLFEDCRNITLDGNNTLVVLHGKMISFAIINCSNIKVRNIRFDYERPTVSEMTIESVTDNRVEVAIHPDSQYAIDSGRIFFYGEGWRSKSYHTIVLDPVANTLCPSTFKPFLESRAVQISPFHVRFEGNFSRNMLHSGEVLTIRDPYRDNCGALIDLSKNIQLEDVKMYFMHGLGIVSQFSENISLLRVEVAPRENSGRIISSFADCFHFSGCKGLVKIDSCLTSGSQDDAVNVHGIHLQIVKVNAGKVTVRFMHHQTYGFRAFFGGDSVAFVDPKTLMSLGTSKLKMAKLSGKYEMEVEVDGTLPSFVHAGLCIENLTWTPEVIIQNSRFERTSTRGLLLTTRKKVIIQNNTFYHIGMYPILIADDASNWFESGPVQDVTIRNNRFDECGYNSGSGAINIAPENIELLEGYFVHKNIRIESNVFKMYDMPLLTARSVEGLVFANNTIVRTKAVPSDSRKASFELTACKGVVIEHNVMEGFGHAVVKLKDMSTSALKTDATIIDDTKK